MTDLARRAAAEALGTALLVCAVVGSGIMAESLTQDTAVALLANTAATAAILVVLISVLAPVSGAHLNPAVSIIFALRRELPALAAIAYVVAQVIGGVLGAVLAHAMFDLPLIAASNHARTGPGQWLSEAVATFGLLFVILTARRSRPTAIPALVGLYIAAAYWFTSSTSFANPAVTIARSLSDTFAGIRPGDVPAFVIAQGLGALLAMVCASLVTAAPPAQGDGNQPRMHADGGPRHEQG